MTENLNSNVEYKILFNMCKNALEDKDETTIYRLQEALYEVNNELRTNKEKNAESLDTRPFL